MDSLCSAVPGAISREVRDKLKDAATVEVVCQTEFDELASISFSGTVDYDLVVRQAGVSRQSGGLLYETVLVIES